MFNIEQSITEWRRQMRAAGIKHPTPLEELEGHLRQEVAALVSSGTPEAEAFRLAVSRLGSPASVGQEFNKIKGAQIGSVKIASLLWLGAVLGTAVWLSSRLFTGKLNLLLYTHVLSVTAGYTAVFLMGFFGICGVCWRRFQKLSAMRQRSLGRGVVAFNYVAVGFVILGTLLGMPVSKKYFGSYWRWDPKEIGALCVATWLLALATLHRFRQMSIRGTILMSLGGSIIVSLAWFGTGIIDYHRRLHGHGTGNYWPLAIFLAVQFFFLMLGLVRSQEPAELRA